MIEASASFAEIPIVGNSLRGHQPVRAEEREAARLIARAVAVSLRDRSVVEYVKAALASSAAREQKLHFASFMSGRGGPLVTTMLRGGGITMAQLTAAIRSIRDLEFYMPVGAHRDRWTGSDVPLVAIALHEDDSPEAYDRNGNRRVLNRVFPPAEPVLVLAPVETDMRAQIELNARGQAEHPCAPRPSETLTAAAARCRAGAQDDRLRPLNNHIPAEITGLYVAAIEFAKDQCGGECWAWGDPEYQIYTLAKTPTSGTTLQLFQCSGDGADVAYRWDMNGRTWAGKGLLLTRDQMEAAVEPDSGWMHQMWEDDQDNCNLLPSIDPWREAQRVIAGVVFGYLAWQANDADGFLAAVRVGATGIQNLIMGGDDHIGTIVQEDVSQFGDGQNSNHNMVIQRDDDGSVFVGRATIKPYTANGVYIGPVARVKMSHPSGTKFPVGSVLKMYAYGFDSYGTYVPNRPVSWSSSNPAVASVDADGVVTGHQQGVATITATIDGVQGSSDLYPTPIGAPVRVTISPSGVTLDPGDFALLTARQYDANGFEVPVEENYVWSSGDPSICGVHDGWVDAVAPGRTKISAVSAEGLRDDANCQVNGGGMSIAPNGPAPIGPTARPANRAGRAPSAATRRR